MGRKGWLRFNFPGSIMTASLPALHTDFEARSYLQGRNQLWIMGRYDLSYGRPTIYGGHSSWSCQSSNTRQRPVRGVKGPENSGIFATSATSVGDWAAYWSPNQPENARIVKAMAQPVNMGTAARFATGRGGLTFCLNKCRVSSDSFWVQTLLNIKTTSVIDKNSC